MYLPKVSALIPCFNTRTCIVQAIDSALSQVGHSVEAVVVDDGSSDGTPDLVDATYGDDERVQLIRLPHNRGPSAARNAGISAARGEWIGLLDSDDLWLPNRLEVLLRHEATADFIADNLMGFDAAAEIETGPIYTGLEDRQLTLLDFIKPSAPDAHDFGYLQPLIRSKFIDQHRIRYNEDVRAGEDLLLNLEILASGGRAFYINDALYIYALPVGAVSRSASPNSRSTADTKPLIRALEKFLDDFEHSLGPRDQIAFDLRLANLKAQAPIGVFHRARASGRYLEMCQLFLREQTVRQKIWQRLFCRFP
ncbi:glycosyltransferase family 2 protein [uncultured Roseibium sp.]|uniref:glycosyltransferase family 2 protein n=1 Tax=uncultured Roseibium sp. TaxID=1936171 RepID=UPI00259A25D5|nr:glycosyltransferase family 2 protein [uncultured Roseibium sp.]